MPKTAESKGTLVYPLVPTFGGEKASLNNDALSYLDTWAEQRGWKVLAVLRWADIGSDGWVQVQARVERITDGRRSG